MNVITLSNIEFEEACIRLSDKVSDVGDLALLIGVRNGGARVAQIVFENLACENKNLKYYEVGASRYATESKNSNSVKFLFNCLPYFLLDLFRVFERYIVSFRMFFVSAPSRSLYLDDELLDLLTNLGETKLLVIDDAIDSGATLKVLLDKLHSINPKLECKVAVLVVTQNNPLVFPDVCLYQNVLLRFPWSSDYKS